MDEQAIKRIKRALNILRPDSVHRADCESEVTEAVRRIGKVRIFSESKRQMHSDAKKLRAAQLVTNRYLSAYGSLTGVTETFAYRLGVLSTLLDELADIEGGSGRDRSTDYQRKYFAAQLALELSLRWRPLILEGSDYLKLTADLYEAGTGEEAGSEMVTACTKVLDNAKKDGYEPDKPGQYLQHLADQTIVLSSSSFDF
jgi:hypothetical protein